MRAISPALPESCVLASDKREYLNNGAKLAHWRIFCPAGLDREKIAQAPIEAGLPQQDILAALLFFNVGVEVGLLAFFWRKHGRKIATEKDRFTTP